MGTTGDMAAVPAAAGTQLYLSWPSHTECRRLERRLSGALLLLPLPTLRLLLLQRPAVLQLHLHLVLGGLLHQRVRLPVQEIGRLLLRRGVEPHGRSGDPLPELAGPLVALRLGLLRLDLGLGKRRRCRWRRRHDAVVRRGQHESLLEALLVRILVAPALLDGAGQCRLQGYTILIQRLLSTHCKNCGMYFSLILN